MAAALVVLAIPISPSASIRTAKPRAASRTRARRPPATPVDGAARDRRPRAKLAVPGPGTDVDQARMRRERRAHAEVRHVDLGPHRAREGVDGGDAGEKPADHLRRDLRRIRADAVVGDAVIAGADQDRAPLERVRWHPAGDRAQLHGELFDAAEAAAGAWSSWSMRSRRGSSRIDARSQCARPASRRDVRRPSAGRLVDGGQFPAALERAVHAQDARRA